ncbi:KISS1 receptor-like protein, partial [Aphelenchoides avenae]
DEFLVLLHAIRHIRPQIRMMTCVDPGMIIVLFAICIELATAKRSYTITCYFENYYGFADGVQACKAKQCFRALRDDGKLTRGCVYDSALCDRPNRTCCGDSFCNGIAFAVLLNQEMRRLNGALSALPVELLVGTVAAIGITANLLVMVAVFGDRKLRQNSMFLLLANWAFSDAAYLCVSSIMALVAISHAASLDQDLLITQIAFYFAKVSIFVSTYTNFAVSVERYYAAVFPLECALEFRPKRTVGYVAKVWAVALLFNAFWIAILIKP